MLDQLILEPSSKSLYAIHSLIQNFVLSHVDLQLSQGTSGIKKNCFEGDSKVRTDAPAPLSLREHVFPGKREHGFPENLGNISVSGVSVGEE